MDYSHGFPPRREGGKKVEHREVNKRGKKGKENESPPQVTKTDNF
jgi:hypothetical protein